MYCHAKKKLFYGRFETKFWISKNNFMMVLLMDAVMLATRRYKSKRGSLFRYWAQRERGLKKKKKKKKKKKGSNLNLGGRRTRVQTSILGEEEGSELESRGEKKKGPK